MQLVLLEGKVIATHTDDQQIEDLYEGKTFYTVPDGTPLEPVQGVPTPTPEPPPSEGWVNPWPTMTDEAKWRGIRAKRGKKLEKSDWSVIPDSDLSGPDKAEWKKYRKDLRDLPQNFPNPDDIVWPTKP